MILMVLSFNTPRNSKHFKRAQTFYHYVIDGGSDDGSEQDGQDDDGGYGTGGDYYYGYDDGTGDGEWLY